MTVSERCVYRPHAAGSACGSPATQRGLVACVHEHVRWVPWCGRCAQVIASQPTNCLLCYLHDTHGHVCEVRLLRNAELVVS